MKENKTMVLKPGNYKTMKLGSLEGIVIFRDGYFCGYVGVPSDHPSYEKEYDELSYIDVHGGLTFSEFEVYGVPGTAENDRRYFGFDCSHASDLNLNFPTSYGVFRDEAFVTNELINLMAQFNRMAEEDNDNESGSIH